MSRSYNDPVGGTPSDIGSQIRTDKFDKQALIEARREQVFLPMADVKSMPKNMGKKIKKYHYLPLLDDANINDQGIDASGATIADGNLYGSSKDVGTIAGKLPTLTENGGRVNRVGFTRVEIEGSIEKFGFFDEYTQESVDFDSDADKQMHVRREMLNGATQMTEAAVQIDLLNSPGIVKLGGDAATVAELDEADEVTYADLLRLSIDLDNNRTPKGTTVSTGTRLIDTKTIAGARYLFCGSELQPTLEAMVDSHGNPAFIPVQQYAAGTSVMENEIGSIGYFRIIIVLDMLKWSGAGAADSASTHYATGANLDVFPMLVIGDGSFSTIGFQTDGKTVKFKITHKEPGEKTADRTDPYGETGFMSIKWYYGFLLQRPERMGLIKTTAVM